MSFKSPSKGIAVVTDTDEKLVSTLRRNSVQLMFLRFLPLCCRPKPAKDLYSVYGEKTYFFFFTDALPCIVSPAYILEISS